MAAACAAPPFMAGPTSSSDSVGHERRQELQLRGAAMAAATTAGFDAAQQGRAARGRGRGRRSSWSSVRHAHCEGFAAYAAMGQQAAYRIPGCEAPWDRSARWPRSCWESAASGCWELEQPLPGQLPGQMPLQPALQLGHQGPAPRAAALAILSTAPQLGGGRGSEELSPQTDPGCCSSSYPPGDWQAAPAATTAPPGRWEQPHGHVPRQLAGRAGEPAWAVKEHGALAGASLLHQGSAAPAATSRLRAGGGPAGYPTPPMPVRNTFLDEPVQRPPSLERFLAERKVRSSPVSRQVSDNRESGEEGPMPINTPSGSNLSTPRGVSQFSALLQPGRFGLGSASGRDLVAAAAAAQLASALAAVAPPEPAAAPAWAPPTWDTGSIATSGGSAGGGGSAAGSTAESLTAARSFPGSGTVPVAEASSRPVPTAAAASSGSAECHAGGAAGGLADEGGVGECGGGAAASAMPGGPVAGKPELGTPGLPNRGSAVHRWGACKPCAFVHKGGCENGVDCQFCHLCEPGEKKRRKKERRTTRREVLDARGRRQVDYWKPRAPAP